MSGGVGGVGGVQPVSQPGSSAAPAGPAPAAPAATAARGSTPNNPLAAIAAAPPTDQGRDLDTIPQLRAYDRLTQGLLTAAGGDGVVSRSEAGGLVESLRQDGRGTEALAAKELFALIDDFDDARGARVTGYDFARAKPLVDLWLARGNGAQSSLGKALHELGTATDVTMFRESFREPEAGMHHIAGLLKGATGGDGVLSRADLDALVQGLEAEGHGDEALGASMFFRFIDHRDHRPGARVTAADIDSAVAYSRDHLLRNKDTNGDGGYSQAEIDTFSTTAKTFRRIGHQLRWNRLGPNVPGPASAVPFDENNPLPAGFQPSRVITDGAFRVANGTVELQGITGSDLTETRLLEAAFGTIWDRSTRNRVWPQGSLANVADNGSMNMGTFTDRDGDVFYVAHWKDIDDDSHVFYFREAQGSTAADPAFELAQDVYLN